MLGQAQREDDPEEHELTEGLLPQHREVHTNLTKHSGIRWCTRVNGRIIAATLLFLIFGLAIAFWPFGFHAEHSSVSCDSISQGYECEPHISKYWGQYSPYYAVSSEIADYLPPNCAITFAQVLSRHGARDPTASKSEQYNSTISKLQKRVKSFHGKYAFLSDYEYTLGADLLTIFGQQQMVNSGIKYYQRYRNLTVRRMPVVRSSGQQRVVQSAHNFTQGYHQAVLIDPTSTTPSTFPYDIVVISEESGSNNTLDHGLCTEFETGLDSIIDDFAQAQWQNVFIPSIQARLNADMSDANLTQTETRYIMDLCPFNTVATTSGTVSPFCALFTEEEWHQYDYFQSLGKYYGYGNGNPLGPTQGVGFVNELVARMTNQSVNDHTSTNTTLDSNTSTFPIGQGHMLFADFSHDNDLTGIFAALGLYNGTMALSNVSLETTEQTKGYSAAWTVPFAARAYVEKMECQGEDEELVRIVVNDRVQPLHTCGGDELGRCKLGAFIESLSFARQGGRWDECFT